jgi:hypothetical protein
MRRLSFLFLLLLLVSCSDVVTERFADLDDARTRRAFDRGWLPPIMPPSAKQIVLKCNLDVNTASCSFDYAAAEGSEYLKRLQMAGASLTKEAEVSILTLATNGSRWVIRLPPNVGRGEFSMAPDPR